jgi:hypothetical protein
MQALSGQIPANRLKVLREGGFLPNFGAHVPVEDSALTDSHDSPLGLSERARPVPKDTAMINAPGKHRVKNHNEEVTIAKDRAGAP